MTYTRDELEKMGLGELVRMVVTMEVGFHVMNDVVDKKSVIDAILEHQSEPGRGARVE